MFDETILSLADEVGSLLGHHGQTVASAESCTGGLLAAAITTITGSSAWFYGGYVTYDNLIKMRALHVNETTLEQYGAVSEPTAAEMARGALNEMSAQWALSTTGIAGPSGGVPGKPVGTVCFGLARRHSPDVTQTLAVTRHFDGDRTDVRLASVRFALGWLLEQLKTEYAGAANTPGIGSRPS